MGTLADVEEVRRGLDAALESVRHDRWQLAGLRDGRLKVIAESRQPVTKQGQRRLDLTPLARRCLYERKPLAISTLAESQPLPGEDWELDWPAILYTPVGLPGLRPVGLITVGSRTSHWYDEEEIDYVGALAITLTNFVAAATGPLGRLRKRELQAAQLLGEGLSDAEIARGMQIERREAKELVSGVLQKLSLRSRHEVRNVFPDSPAAFGPFLL